MFFTTVLVSGSLGKLDNDWYDGIVSKLKWNQSIREIPSLPVTGDQPTVAAAASANLIDSEGVAADMMASGAIKEQPQLVALPSRRSPLLGGGRPRRQRADASRGASTRDDGSGGGGGASGKPSSTRRIQ